MRHALAAHACRHAVVLAASVGLLPARVLSAQPSTSRLEPSTPLRAEFAVNTGVGSERLRNDYGADIRERTAVVLLGVRKTYDSFIGARVVGVYIDGRSTQRSLYTDITSSFSVLGAMLVSDLSTRPTKNTELGVHLGVGFAPFLHSASRTSGNVSENPYLNSTSTQQTLLGLGGLRVSWGPLFIEADFMLLDFGESWRGEYDGALSPIMLGVRLPLARRR